MPNSLLLPIADMPTMRKIQFTQRMYVTKGTTDLTEYKDEIDHSVMGWYYATINGSDEVVSGGWSMVNDHTSIEGRVQTNTKVQIPIVLEGWLPYSNHVTVESAFSEGTIVSLSADEVIPFNPINSQGNTYINYYIDPVKHNGIIPTLAVKANGTEGLNIKPNSWLCDARTIYL